MNDERIKIEAERQLLAEAQAKGGLTKFGTYARMSGPGWLQGAITLGAGSLASSLYLGTLSGFSLLWLQPLAMLFGIVMLSCIGYVTLTTGEQPLQAVRQHVSPVLAWAWAICVFVSCVVFGLPQVSAASGVLRGILFPSLLGSDGMLAERFGGDTVSLVIISVSFLLVATIMTWSYNRGGWGLRLYETILKIIVAIIVFSFFGVVITLTFSTQALDWGAVLAGFVPDFTQFFHPAATFHDMLEAIGPASSEARLFWSDQIVSKQQDVMISAVATAVGINMTFLLPYSLLRKGWSREHRGLANFDLAIGLFIPYMLATACVVIVASTQFHTQVTNDFEIVGNSIVAPERFESAFEGLLDARRQSAVEISEDVSLAEKRLAATLVNRKALDLSQSITPLTGSFMARIIFGVGVLGMTLSTLSIQMLTAGFVLSEMLGRPPLGRVHLIGTLIAGVLAALGPFIWGTAKASFYLVIPTSIFSFVLLPFAYITFAILMNQKSLLGDDRPAGYKRWIWNILLGVAATFATIGSAYMIWIKAGVYGYVAGGIFLLLGVILHFMCRGKVNG